MVPRSQISQSLHIPRVLTGLWQVADIENSGQVLDPEPASDALLAYADMGLDGFDMADHYGSAEVIAGLARRKLLAQGQTSAQFLTKWCPAPDECTKSAVRAGVQARLDRLDTDCLDMLQLHWWAYEHPGWIDVLDELMNLKSEGKIAALGVTNFDTDHLAVALSEGFEIATNQVSFSALDRRAAGDMSALCAASGVKLLAYGTLLGGLLSDRWLGAPEPADIPDWSKKKYKRFIDTAGGWDAFQELLSALKVVADRHATTISGIASAWVLAHPAVAAVIIGARLTETEHRRATLEMLKLKLTPADFATLEPALKRLTRVPGDCGDEYRRAPFLTASGDLSHHLDELPKVYKLSEGKCGPARVSSGSVWEDLAGFSRAIRVGDRIIISGTTATHGAGRAIGAADARAQTVYILDKIAAALSGLGGCIDDVVRTRVYLTDVNDWQAVSQVHGRVFAKARPANTLLGISALVGGYMVEIEAEAIVT